jgi:hypothetical protein
MQSSAAASSGAGFCSFEALTLGCLRSPLGCRWAMHGYVPSLVLLSPGSFLTLALVLAVAFGPDRSEPKRVVRGVPCLAQVMLHVVQPGLRDNMH